MAAGADLAGVLERGLDAAADVAEGAASFPRDFRPALPFWDPTV